MEPTTLIILGIVIFFLLILLTLLFAMIYSGLLYNIVVKVGDAPIDDFIGFYKVYTGSYKDAYNICTEATSIAPYLNTFGVYYDDPVKVKSENLRSAVGSIILKGHYPDEEINKYEELFKKYSFKKFTFKKADVVVKTDFPNVSFLSVMLSIYRVYPTLDRFIDAKKLSPYPFVEYYTSDKIIFFAPLNNHHRFYPPEISLYQ